MALKLDAIPNGFPETESGVELKLLAKIFSLEEAALASEMQSTLQSTEQIAWKRGIAPARAAEILENMARKGLVRRKTVGGQRRFGLRPFVVGIYESQLGRLDKELASLFEEYYPAFAEKVLGYSPPVHKIIPVERSIPMKVQVFPYEQASALLNKAKAFGVQKCICRVQRKMVGKPCKYPEEVCLVFAPIENVFDDNPDVRIITKEEALKILKETEKAGLIHSSTNVREGHHYICNCCTCCCGIMRGLSQFGIANSVAKSDFYTIIDPDLCIGCGTCRQRCQFDAPTILENISNVDQERCVGCGLCVITCPTQAIALKRKETSQTPPTPGNIKEWMTSRAMDRGILNHQGS